MRLIGTLLTFFLLVFSAHWAILALNPGIAEPHAAAPTTTASARTIASTSR